MDANRNLPPSVPSDRSDDDPWLSVLEAARVIGVSKPTVYALATRREILTQLVAGRVFVRRDSAEKARAARDARLAQRERATA